MNVAVSLLVYASLLIWLGPRLLRRITVHGVHPRLSVAVWLAAVFGVVAAWFGGLTVLFLNSLTSPWRYSALRMCLKVLGLPVALNLSLDIRSAVAQCLLTAGAAASIAAIMRIVDRLRLQQSRSRQHASTARMIGRIGVLRGVVVIHAVQPLAYCVAGRPHAVVVTTGALARLDEPQLAAVVAHEYAHLKGHHHTLLTMVRAMATSLSRLPLFLDAADAVADLLEMCADDVAVRVHDPTTLMGGLLALVAPEVPASALGAASTAVLARAARLTNPAPRGIRWRHGVLLMAVAAIVILIPVVICALTCCPGQGLV